MVASGKMTRVIDLWRRFVRGVHLAWRATGRGVIEFYHSNNLTFASSIAYYSLLSIFPFVLMVFSVLNRIAVTRSGDEQAVMKLVERALPSNFDFLSAQFSALQKTPIELSIAGMLLTVWASMGVFGAITSAVNHAWGVEKPYSYFMHKLIAFVMLLAAALVFTCALFLVGGVQLAEARWFHPARDWFPSFQWVPGFVSRNALMPGVVLAVGLIYYFAPNHKVRLRDVWYGAVLSALLWRGALAGFSWYLREFARFTVHGYVGTVIAFLVWVYLSAVILLYGVEVTAAYARLRRDPSI
jgi:membrane protein